MSGIVTVYNCKRELLKIDDKFKRMTHLLKNNTCSIQSPRCYISCASERMRYRKGNQTYVIAYHGEIYNILEIKNSLIKLGYHFETTSDEEVIVNSFIEYQDKCLDFFDGAFVFVIDDGNRLFIARDALGIKPIYYYQDEETLVVASEIKCILEYIGKAVVDQEGVKELLALGPSLTPGRTIYKDIYALRAGYFMFFDGNINTQCYFKLHDQKHTDNLEETKSKVKNLIIDSIQKRLSNGCEVSSMLSGGLDSSIVTAIASQYISPLPTYSISYEDQDKYFKAYDYQTTMDDDYIQEMIDQYHPNHKKVILSQESLIDTLQDALTTRDMPGMADIDSSLLLFSKEISKNKEIALSGECADEIFGGYPWFYKPELYNQPYFPWMRDLDKKFDLFNEKVKALHLKDYIIRKYQDTLDEINTDDKKKQLIYLNMQWFMQTLLTRADTQASLASLIVRVPFASKDILQYLYNMPWDYMYLHKEEKGILRYAFEEFLPEDIAHRKKNPFPKTHSPLYQELIYTKLKESLKDSSNILYQFFDKDKLFNFVESKGESFQTPWFGQLMMGPQLMAYFYQIYLWGKIYHIELEF